MNKNKQPIIIIAGPCSIDYQNIEEVLELLDMKVNSKRAISGVRLVGLKSRTNFNSKGDGMGIDFAQVLENLRILKKGGTVDDLKPLPSINLAKVVLNKANVIIATEVMMPMVQLPIFENYLQNVTLLPWNPAVDQLGWHLLQVGLYAGKNNWLVGIKNGKWVGEKIAEAESENFIGETSIERTWKGLVSYVEEGLNLGIRNANNSKDLNKKKHVSKTHNLHEGIFLIQRGVDIPERADYRNYPIHNIAKRVKLATGKKLLFDPSHTLGPKLRDKIIESTIKAMKIKIDENNYLYDGILIEVGTSKTDTQQHLTIKELEELVGRLAEFREVYQI